MRLPAKLLQAKPQSNLFRYAVVPVTSQTVPAFQKVSCNVWVSKVMPGVQN